METENPMKSSSLERGIMETWEQIEKFWGSATVEQKLDFLLSEIKHIHLNFESERIQRMRMDYLQNEISKNGTYKIHGK